jgi:hypothetical protein
VIYSFLSRSFKYLVTVTGLTEELSISVCGVVCVMYTVLVSLLNVFYCMAYFLVFANLRSKTC